MLVLSRRQSEKIVFPTLGVTLHILGTKGGTVKLGIEAPPEIKVLREELAPASVPATPPAKSPMHALRNRLNKLGLSLHLFERLWHAGQNQEAGTALERVLDLLDGVEQECAAADRPRLAAPPGPAKVRSLVVEDDNNERELLAGLLRMNGCECETAADGLEALDYLSSHDNPDVVLLDLRMPRCDGPETLARIRSNPRFAGLKVFAVSGTRPQDLGIGTGPNGVDGWFPKPVNPRKLWDALQDSLRAHCAKN